jgi:MFS family permease
VEEPPPESSDRRRLSILVVGFGTALGVTAFTYPLLALESGLSATAVGLLASVSAALQMASRLVLPYLLSRFLDRSLMVFALLVMAVSAGALLVTQALIGFVVAQVGQGFARGVFHTASQTHAVRNPGVASRGLAFVQTTAQFGRLIGPAVAGSLAVISLRASLIAAVALAGAGALFAATLVAMPPYRRDPPSDRKPIWRRGDLAMAYWGGAAGGVWRGLSESFVPVILTDRGLAPSVVGWLLSLADGAGFLTTASVARWGRDDVRPFVPLAATALAVALVLMPLASGVVLLGALMLVAGSSGGVSGVLGTAVANETVEESEQGAAITLVGTYRAGARLAAPATVSGTLSALALPAAMACVAGAIFAPTLWFGPRHSRARRAGTVDQ